MSQVLYSVGDNVIKVLDLADGSLLNQYNLPVVGIESSISDNGYIYLTTSLSDHAGNYKYYVVCCNTHQVVWQCEVSGVFGSLCIEGDYIYAFTVGANFQAYKINKRTGALVWVFVPQHASSGLYFGAVGDKIYLNDGTTLDKDDGSVTGENVYPASNCLIQNSSGNLILADAQGNIKWYSPTGEYIKSLVYHGMSFSNIIELDNGVAVANGYYDLVAFNTSASTMWHYHVPEGSFNYRIVTFDSGNNVYVHNTGLQPKPVVKISSSGAKQWSQAMDGYPLAVGDSVAYESAPVDFSNVSFSRIDNAHVTFSGSVTISSAAKPAFSGVVWSKNIQPNLSMPGVGQSHFDVADNSLSGEITGNFDLGATYYFCLFVVNNDKTYYSDQISLSFANNAGMFTLDTQSLPGTAIPRLMPSVDTLDARALASKVLPHTRINQQVDTLDSIAAFGHAVGRNQAKLTTLVDGCVIGYASPQVRQSQSVATLDANATANALFPSSLGRDGRYVLILDADSAVGDVVPIFRQSQSVTTLDLDADCGHAIPGVVYVAGNVQDYYKTFIERI